TEEAPAGAETRLARDQHGLSFHLHFLASTGSKFIRLSDLDKKTLTICQPNRRKCGPMREISDSLQSMIKDLVFNNELSQEKYDNLSIDDKKLFKEVLSITHLQYNFSEQLEDPVESLRM
ncbi:hypothetical protein F444_14791, partial [Phytophthora nicotianae P1976]